MRLPQRNKAPVGIPGKGRLPVHSFIADRDVRWLFIESNAPLPRRGEKPQGKGRCLSSSTVEEQSLLTTKPKKFDILHVYLDSAVPV